MGKMSRFENIKNRMLMGVCVALVAGAGYYSYMIVTGLAQIVWKLITR